MKFQTPNVELSIRSSGYCFSLRFLTDTCSACFKQYNKKEYLIEHKRTSYHSPHRPKCGL